MTSIKKTLPKCKISSVIGLFCFVLYAHTTSAASLNIIHTGTFIMNSTITQIQRPFKIRPTIREYEAERLAVVAQERASNFESDTPELTEREQLANDIVMKFKQEDLSNGHQNPRNFAPSQYFFDVIDQIRESKLFKIIRIMPKGGILHTHDTAVASLDYLISVTYREHLWQGVDTETNEIEDFIFSRESPADLKPHLNWTLAAKERSSRGRDNYDAYIRSLFTLRNNIPRNTHRDINKVWDIFGNMFRLAEPLISFVPVWSDYYRETLREALQDNVQYMEFRGTLPTLYDLDGNNYSPSDSIQLYVDVLKDFKNENPDFIGSKFIFAPVKAVPDSVVEEYMRIVVQLHEEFPEFMAGFDLVGREADSRQLISFTERILELPTDIKLFFHAGETNWFGSVDENMIDAILLGSLRVGHGFALAKHPTLLQLVKERDIAVEVNPVSNQLLTLVDDMRNHPAATYFAMNIPVVISSDNPTFFEVYPLSDDFYQAFLGISSSHSNLRTLKKLATNSIKYSSLSAAEKVEAVEKWSRRWDTFVEQVIANDF